MRFGKIGQIHSPKCITIGEIVSFGDWIYLTAWSVDDKEGNNPKLNIGNNCSFGAFNHITCINSVNIGYGTLTGKWVTITDNSHGDTDYESLQMKPTNRTIISKGAVKIGNNVWIGDKATIISASIGDGAVIAANCVVTKDVPAYSVVGGNPMKILKQNY